MPKTPTLPHTVVTLIESDHVLDLLTRSLRDQSLRAEACAQLRALNLVEADLGLLIGSHHKILGTGHNLLLTNPVEGPPDRRRFEEVAQAWLSWSDGNAAVVVPNETKSAAAGGGLNLMAYNLWAVAVQALIDGELSEAERFYRRLLELGSQYDIEHFRAIQWTYAASFFHSGLTSEG